MRLLQQHSLDMHACQMWWVILDGHLECEAVWVCLIRWFIVDDVDMLEDDLSQLQALFEADGEGLQRGDIQVSHA